MAENNAPSLELKQLAHQTYEWAKRYADLFPGRFWGLSGMCLLASQKLFAALQLAGISASIAMVDEEGAGHCFVLCEDLIVDVTIEQFTDFYGPIAFLPVDSGRKLEWFWEKFKEFDSIESVIMASDGWPAEQRYLEEALLVRDEELVPA